MEVFRSHQADIFCSSLQSHFNCSLNLTYNLLPGLNQHISGDSSDLNEGLVLNWVCSGPWALSLHLVIYEHYQVCESWGRAPLSVFTWTWVSWLWLDFWVSHLCVCVYKHHILISKPGYASISALAQFCCMETSKRKQEGLCLTPYPSFPHITHAHMPHSWLKMPWKFSLHLESITCINTILCQLRIFLHLSLVLHGGSDRQSAERTRRCSLLLLNIRWMRFICIYQHQTPKNRFQNCYWCVIHHVNSDFE